MFSLKAIAILALPLLAVANPIAARTDGSCNTDGSVNCCNVNGNGEASNCKAGQLFEILDLGILSSSCDNNQQTVCCMGNNFNGLINLGCTPINLNA